MIGSLPPDGGTLDRHADHLTLFVRMWRGIDVCDRMIKNVEKGSQRGADVVHGRCFSFPSLVTTLTTNAITTTIIIMITTTSLDTVLRLKLTTYRISSTSIQKIHCHYFCCSNLYNTTISSNLFLRVFWTAGGDEHCELLPSVINVLDAKR